MITSDPNFFILPSLEVMISMRTFRLGIESYYGLA